MTLFTKATEVAKDTYVYEYLEDRPILLLTSTTYTEDEVAAGDLENRIPLFSSY